METTRSFSIIVGCALILILSFLFWRYVWFFRSPPRTVPSGHALVSPADGTVVYVKVVEPDVPVIAIKKGIEAKINDIVRDDLARTRLLIGIFMSPWDVHYNRAPLAGIVESIRHHPAVRRNLHMTWMQVRTLLNWPPFHMGSRHIVENERTVTRIVGGFQGRELSCYVVQIAGGSVSGIDSYVSEGHLLDKGDVFGMIRIGSQVDVVMPHLPDMHVKVRPGQKVWAGESVLVD